MKPKNNLDFENWDPMAEDYACPKFNSYMDTNSSVLFDMTGLYIKNIPADLSEDEFLSILCENNRKIRRHHLYPAKPNSQVTCGLASFTSESFALDAMQSLNRRPPYNFNIQYAKKKENKNTLKDNANLPVNDFQSQSNLLKIGRGKPIRSDSITSSSLKIVLDGGKRTTYHEKAVDDILIQRQSELQPPALISNPFILCLSCKKTAHHSCGTCQKPYCSRKCQEEDWPKHKAVCLTFNKDPGKKGSVPHGSTSAFGNDSSYMSEGSSCSDNDKNSELIQSSNRNASNIKSRTAGSQTQHSKTPVSIENSNTFQNKKSKQNVLPDSQVKLKVINAVDIEETPLPLKPNVKVHVSDINTPSCFWVQLESANRLLSEMENELTSSVQEKAGPCAVNNICCIFHNERLKRVQVLKPMPTTSLVQFIDYGGTSTVPNHKLFNLPEMFKKYPVQAICCNLVDSSKDRNIQWNEEEVSAFQCFALDKSYSAYVYGCTNKKYDVSLYNDEGVSVFAMVSLSRLQEEVQNSTSTCLEIPTVWTNLKNGMEFSVAAVEFENDKFWGLLDDTTELSETMNDIEVALKNLDSPDISISCEEGDAAVCLSPEFGVNYRCVVMKRLQNSFLVHYLDYGNREEVTRLYSLPSNLLKKKSYVVCCTKPDSLSDGEFKSIFANGASGCVKAVKSDFVELTIHSDAKTLTVKCFPWHHGIISKSDAVNQLPHSDLRNNTSSSPKPNTFPIQPPPKVMQDEIDVIKVQPGAKLDVKIVYIKTSSEIYVQLVEDEKNLFSFSQKLNQYGNSKSCSTKYAPVKNEIVCCKFSEDGNWYRGQVLSKSGSSFRVLFIDFGNEENVSDINIKPLPKTFVCPKFSILISLFNIKNEDISKELLSKLINELWIMEIKSSDKSPVKVMLFQGAKSFSDFIIKRNYGSLTFQKLPIGSSDVQICHADKNKLYLHQQKDIQAVESLCDKLNSTEKKAVSSKVIINNVYCGLFSDGLWYRVSVEKELSSSSFMVNFIDFGNKEEISIKDLKELPDEFLVYPVFCIPVIATNVDATTCQLQKTCTVEVVSEKNGVQEVKFPNSFKPPSLSAFHKSKLENGVSEIVFCHVENNTYYCHLKSNLNDLATMSESLQSCLKQKKSLGHLSVGDVLCAKSIDGCWYRASVESFSSKDSTCEMLFIDYGNTETVASENIVPLEEEYHEVPIFSIPVKISNLNKVQQVSLESVISVKTVGFSADNVQSVELVLPKSDLLKTETLKKQILSKDLEVDLSICHVEGDIFYGHMKSALELIKALEAKLLKASEFSDLISLPEVGDLLCAKFVDGIWYRGSVEEVCDNKSCKISFIDYGNSEVISLENMKVLPQSLCSFPIFSLPFKLRNIELLQEQLAAEFTLFRVKVMDIKEDVYIVEVLPSRNPTELLMLQSQTLPLTPVEVIVCHKEEKLFFVQKCSDLETLAQLMADLQIPESRKSISPQIGELVCVKYQDGLLYRGVVKEKCNNAAVKVFFVDYGNTDIVNVSDVFVLPSKCLATPKFCITVELSQTLLVNPLIIDSQYLVKVTGKMNGDIHVINVCPSIPSVQISSLKTSSLPDHSEVCFLSFDGENHFVRQSSHASEIDRMEKMLENLKGDKILHVASVNEVLVVKCKDNIWRRGCVKESNESLGCYKVFLVDLGTVEDIFTCDICYIPEKLTSFPVFSLKVKVNPANPSISLGMCYDIRVINRTVGNVPVVIIQSFMYASLEHRFLPLHKPKEVIFIHKEQDTMFLQVVSDMNLLAEIQTEVIKCAAFDALSYNPAKGELLCAQSVADGSWYRGCVTESVSCDTYKILFIDYGNSEIISKESLRPFSKKLMDYPSLSIAVKMDSNPGEEVALEKLYRINAESEPCDNIQLVKLDVPKSDLSKVNNENCSVSPDNSNSSSTFSFTNSKYVPFPSGEQEVVIYFIGESCYVFCAPFNQENITSNVHLTSEITEFCNNLNCTQYNGSSSPEVDEMVLAKFDEDKQWYRAVVFSKTPPFYDVLFVDYGNSEQIHENSLRRMEQKFMHLEIQAHLCLLTGFSVDEENYPAVTEELKNFTMLPLKAVVNTVGEDMTVCIPSITNHLVEKKLVSALS